MILKWENYSGLFKRNPNFKYENLYIGKERLTQVLRSLFCKKTEVEIKWLQPKNHWKLLNIGGTKK